jgi:hypothetical protein
MKKISVKNIWALAALLSLGACKKQLDLYPYSSIEISQSFKTVKDATTYNVGLYADFRGTQYGSYMFSQDVQADQLNATLDFGNRNGNPHRWGQSFLSDDGALSGAWAGYYFALRNINLCIENFPKIPTTTPAEATSLNKYIGDAYLARAYYYSELIKRFAKPYEAATASSDLGVPLVLKYDVPAKPTRATVKQVYDQILADIAQAKTLITNSGTVGASSFNKDVVLALESRVRLNMQDWSGAMAIANTLISSGTYPLVTTSASFSAMWKTDATAESIMQCFVSAPNELPNTNNIYLGYTAATGRYTPDFLPTQSIINFFETGDYRKTAYFAVLPVTIQGVAYSTLTLVNKYPGNPSLFTTAATNYAQAPKAFRIAEQYLIYAEAAARLGGANEALGLARLNLLRQARGLTASTATGAAYLQAVKDERTREFAFEGYRLWDLKRWHEGFTRGTPQNLNPINQGPTYNLLTIQPDDLKFVWGLPLNDMTANPNLTQNPGW